MYSTMCASICQVVILFFVESLKDNELILTWATMKSIVFTSLQILTLFTFQGPQLPSQLLENMIQAENNCCTIL